MRSLVRFLVILCCFSLSIAASAEDKAALSARLQRVDTLTRLDDPALKPWAMKLSFQLYDDAGKTKEQGTLEEWWAGPSLYKQTVTSASYTATTIVNKDGHFRSSGSKQTPYLLELIERQMVHPMPSGHEVNGLSPQTIKLEASGPTPECIMMGESMRNVPFPQVGLLPTYCMVAGKDLLQVSFDYGNLMVARTAMGAFQQKVMPIDIKVALNRVDAASSHLLSLRVYMPGDSDFAVPASGMERLEPEQVHMEYSAIRDTSNGNIAPMMPPDANVNAVSAPVEIRVFIGTDGKVHGLRLLSTPDAKLAAPAMWAVERWSYSPPMKSGQPVEVETVIPVYFAKQKGHGEIGPKDAMQEEINTRKK